MTDDMRPSCPICGQVMLQESKTAEPGSMAFKERRTCPESDLCSSLPSVPVVLEPYRLHFVFVCPGGHP